MALVALPQKRRRASQFTASCSCRTAEGLGRVLAACRSLRAFLGHREHNAGFRAPESRARIKGQLQVIGTFQECHASSIYTTFWVIRCVQIYLLSAECNGPCQKVVTPKLDLGTGGPPAKDRARSFSSRQGRKKVPLRAFPDPGVFKTITGLLLSSIKFQGTDGQPQTSQSKKLFAFMTFRKKTSLARYVLDLAKTPHSGKAS